MKNVLIPFDGSEAATRAVQYIVDRPQAHRPSQVHLLNVQQIDVRQIPVIRGPYDYDAACDSLRAIGQRVVASAEEKLRTAGLAFETHVEVGFPEDIIADHAANLDCDHIVMGTRGMGAIKGMLLGSTATKVIHLSNVPVILIK